MYKFIISKNKPPKLFHLGFLILLNFVLSELNAQTYCKIKFTARDCHGDIRTVERDSYLTKTTYVFHSPANEPICIVDILDTCGTSSLYTAACIEKTKFSGGWLTASTGPLQPFVRKNYIQRVFPHWQWQD
ncbi:MAG TPA: hypothetical protein PK006_01175 [Saprospiraceae bacterium]|nr:hypothetical protein [Saprospiraceae bacterium]